MILFFVSGARSLVPIMHPACAGVAHAASKVGPLLMLASALGGFIFGVWVEMTYSTAAMSRMVSRHQAELRRLREQMRQLVRTGGQRT